MSCRNDLQRVLLRVRGVVQGVGFRPAVYRLAVELGLAGYVLNDAQGVEIELVGPAELVDRFTQRLRSEPPPLAHIESIEVTARGEPVAPQPVQFVIRESRESSSRLTLISPDIATCDDCVRELLDPADRRFRYPFLNCTNCGPRYTIINDIPYDRPRTTMAPFDMCPACRKEYDDPRDRRFHAQPTCCPECGPALALYDASKRLLALGRGRHTGLRNLAASAACEAPRQDPVALAAAALNQGSIVAVKGLGGFHLACDAADAGAVARLRQRKHRDEKPFAVMSASLAAVESYAAVGPEQGQLLTRRERPIALLDKRQPFPLAEEVAPANRRVGAMLPYTPLHHLLLAAVRSPALVMTSANLSDEPIVTGNEEAFVRLGGIADLFLLHNRDILLRLDDSVLAMHRGRPLPMRRSRGFAPAPIDLGAPSQPTLAVGGELKCTVCLTRDRHAFLSGHIGDLEEERTLDFFQEAVAHLSRITDVRPEVVVHDLHPEYFSTRYALALPGVARVGVQHHHAHILSCLAEHRERRPVVGIALDGTGYGTDGKIWGSEILVVDGPRFDRAAHFKYLPLPGNALAVKQPWRMALACLLDAFGGLDPAWSRHVPWLAGEQCRMLAQTLLQGRIRFVESCGCGRLFDAVSALLDVRTVNRFEGQAAMMLEMAASLSPEPPYPVDVRVEDGGDALDFAPCFRTLLADRLAGVPVPLLSARFHATVAAATAAAALRTARKHGLDTVALSGGVFQNRLLAGAVEDLLVPAGLRVLRHSLVPPNDAGISLGQAYLTTWNRLT